MRLKGQGSPAIGGHAATAEPQRLRLCRWLIDRVYGPGWIQDVNPALNKRVAAWCLSPWYLSASMLREIVLARSNDTYVLPENPRLRLECEELLGKIIGFQTIARPAEILFICNRSRRMGNVFASLRSQIDVKCNELDLSPQARCAAQRHASRLLRDGLGSLFESHFL
jgi:hypothetical protein